MKARASGTIGLFKVSRHASHPLGGKVGGGKERLDREFGRTPAPDWVHALSAPGRSLAAPISARDRRAKRRRPAMINPSVFLRRAILADAIVSGAMALLL